MHDSSDILCLEDIARRSFRHTPVHNVILIAWQRHTITFLLCILSCSFAFPENAGLFGFRMARFAACGGRRKGKDARTPRAPAGGLAALLYHLLFRQDGYTKKPCQKTSDACAFSLKRAEPTSSMSDEVGSEKPGQGQERPSSLITEPTRTFQSLAHLIEGCAIDLTTRIAPAQDFPCVRFKGHLPRRVERPVRVSPAEPAARAPAEEYNHAYPEQWKQGPEAHSPVHMQSPSLSLFAFSWFTCSLQSV
jgi:hypothetical protein